MQHAVLELDGRLSPTLELRASVHGLDAAVVTAFMPDVLAAGTLDADAQLRGSTAAPSGLVTVKAAGVRLASSAVRDLHAIDMRATARLEENAARLDVHVSAGQESHLALAGTAPLGATGALDLKLTGRIDGALANPVLEARGERAAGALIVNATVTGTVQSPEIGGTIRRARTATSATMSRDVHLTAISGASHREPGHLEDRQPESARSARRSVGVGHDRSVAAEASRSSCS